MTTLIIFPHLSCQNLLLWAIIKVIDMLHTWLPPKMSLVQILFLDLKTNVTVVPKEQTFGFTNLSPPKKESHILLMEMLLAVL